MQELHWEPTEELVPEKQVETDGPWVDGGYYYFGTLSPHY